MPATLGRRARQRRRGAHVALAPGVTAILRRFGASETADDALDDGIPLPGSAGPLLVELVSMNLGTSFCSVVEIPDGP